MYALGTLFACCSLLHQSYLLGQVADRNLDVRTVLHTTHGEPSGVAAYIQQVKRLRTFTVCQYGLLSFVYQCQRLAERVVGIVVVEPEP